MLFISTILFYSTTTQPYRRKFSIPAQAKIFYIGKSEYVLIRKLSFLITQIVSSLSWLKTKYLKICDNGWTKKVIQPNCAVYRWQMENITTICEKELNTIVQGKLMLKVFLRTILISSVFCLFVFLKINLKSMRFFKYYSKIILLQTIFHYGYQISEYLILRHYRQKKLTGRLDALSSNLYLS